MAFEATYRQFAKGPCRPITRAGVCAIRTPVGGYGGVRPER